MAQSLFPPEGRGTPAPDAQALWEAAGSDAIYEATTVKCTDSQDLIVDLGTVRGIIPRAEAALGTGEGAVRDIAIISRVGKPVCFTVTGRRRDGDLLLSRRAAQTQAREYLMQTLGPGDILPARVTHLEHFGVFADIGCGIISFIGIENISVSRIPHPAHRFAPGQDILAAVLSRDEARGRLTLTHRELLGTWAENAAAFAAGDTVQGLVRGIESYGMFVELTPNLSGLAEVRPGFCVGDRVSVHIKSMVPQRMKIKLAAVERLPGLPPRLIGPEDYYIKAGRLVHWHYTPPGCQKTIERRFDGV